MYIMINEQEFGKCMVVAGERFCVHKYGKFHARNRIQWLSIFEGTLSEYAVAKMFGIEWKPVIDRPDKGNDVGNVEVRFSNSSTSNLIIRPNDLDHSPFIFVTSAPIKDKDPEIMFNIHGFKFGIDAKVEKYLYPSPPAMYLVPKSELSSIEDHFSMLKQYALQQVD